MITCDKCKQRIIDRKDINKIKVEYGQHSKLALYRIDNDCNYELCDKCVQEIVLEIARIVKKYDDEPI